MIEKPKQIERSCKYHGLTTFFLEPRGYYRCLLCRRERVIATRRNHKQRLVVEFGGKCELCGYDRCVRNLHFHHKDPKFKSFGISKSGNTISYARKLAEARKCVLLCSNCHGEVEEGLITIPG